MNEYHFDYIVVAKGPESDVSPSLSKSQLHQSHQSSQYWSPEINFMFMVQYYSHCNKYIISIRPQNIFSLQSKHLKIKYILRPMLSLVVLTFVGHSVPERVSKKINSSEVWCIFLKTKLYDYSKKSFFEDFCITSKPPWKLYHLKEAS